VVWDRAGRAKRQKQWNSQGGQVLLLPGYARRFCKGLPGGARFRSHPRRQQGRKACGCGAHDEIQACRRNSQARGCKGSDAGQRCRGGSNGRGGRAARDQRRHRRRRAREHPRRARLLQTWLSRLHGQHGQHGQHGRGRATRDSRSESGAQDERCRLFNRPASRGRGRGGCGRACCSNPVGWPARGRHGAAAAQLAILSPQEVIPVQALVAVWARCAW
jgi:hypothetical protein